MKNTQYTKPHVIHGKQHSRVKFIPENIYVGKKMLEGGEMGEGGQIRE